MKGKSIFGFLIVGTMAIVIISFSWIFLNREAGSAQLQERMISELKKKTAHSALHAVGV